MNPLKTVIVTGSNRGLGYACAKQICQGHSDWFVLLACRNEVKAQQALEEIVRETGNTRIGFLPLDLASFDSVHRFVTSFLQADYPPLHGIICNAGVALGDALTTTVDGIETCFQVNCLGHFLLVNLLLPHIRPSGRILMVSSELHRNDGPMKSFRPDFKSVSDMAYPPSPPRPIKNAGSKRYAATKLCLLFYTYELARRLSLQNTPSITVNAFNPGLMPDTGLGGLNTRHLTRFFLKYLLPLFVKGAVSSPSVSGKILASLLLDSQYQGLSGRYFDWDKVIPSSQQSYDTKEWLAAVWQESEALVGLNGKEIR
ncbi:SDR family NAD(P)-dependent oxidoreductase [Cytophagales bacterium LB-30]|uniref:SDR family NAD(P)-dependent oxidoreductase n=1 Tax=Shiella aurantiaca TaxID=3058365 RepID=A0ABT8F838_9BACT|nr:SDR family NAD(P)-dependent oxidoreductase [Shiella aurantiaca]MDN4166630.1 SDR family NAD(P)-dependent oxidoreductase [Shiella aurantiaca]